MEVTPDIHLRGRTDPDHVTVSIDHESEEALMTTDTGTLEGYPDMGCDFAALLNVKTEAESHPWLRQIEHGLLRAPSVCSRLDLHVENARPHLIATLLTNGDPEGWNGDGYEIRECMLFCLLTRDWWNLTKLAEVVPGAKAMLMRALRISDDEWLELQEDFPPFVEDPFAEAKAYHERLLSLE
jgi:hypothetical protein